MELENHLRLILTAESNRSISRQARMALAHHGNSSEARRLIQEAVGKRKQNGQTIDPVEILGIKKEDISINTKPGEKIIGLDGRVVYASRGQTQNHI